MLTPFARRVISRTRLLKRARAFGAMTRWTSGPSEKLNPRNFRSCGFATAIFVDAVSGKLVHRIGPLAAIVAYLAVSPDGKHLSTVLARDFGMMLPAPVLVWDAASGMKIAEWTPPSVALGAVCSEDGHWLVVTSTPTALHVWRVY
jgi:hypothetical protein